ncbi:MAG: amino acid permease, partial [Malacoplasma sp.]|nr:amino acid permease [Malacoplasma sp.]
MVAKEEKVTVKSQTAAKIGLMTAISLIICSVVGVGIFFKNGSVFKNNNGNAIGVLVSWIITSVIALFTAISFAEIVTVKKCAGTNAGLGGWTGAFCGYNFGRAVKIWMPTFYYSLKTVSMSIFAAAG